MSAISATPPQPPNRSFPVPPVSGDQRIQLTEAIRSAIELDIFTAIGAGHTTAEAVASHCSIAERGARILCDFLVVNDSSVRVATSTRERASAKFLDRNSPAYVGPAPSSCLAMNIRQNFRDLTNAVRHGGCQHTYAHAPESPVWVAFARSMAADDDDGVSGDGGNRGRQREAHTEGAGHRGRARAVWNTVLRANPKAEVTAVDWKNVLEVARRTQRSSESRIATRIFPEAFSTWISERGTT